MVIKGFERLILTGIKPVYIQVAQSPSTVLANAKNSGISRGDRWHLWSLILIDLSTAMVIGRLEGGSWVTGPSEGGSWVEFKNNN